MYCIYKTIALNHLFEGYDYSSGWEAFGWFLELTPIVITFTYPAYLAVKLLWSQEQEGKTVLQTMTSPNRSWHETDRSDGGGKNEAVIGSAAKSERRRSIASFELSKM